MRCLVTGATGYIGGRLVPELLAAGHEVRVLARHPERLVDRTWIGQVEVVPGDATDPDAVRAALTGVDVAYYLLHSLQADGDFAEVERRMARLFAATARECAVGRLVYLGALLPHDPDVALSHHFSSRGEVGETLRLSGVPTVELRAAVIIGSGSVSFEIIRYLTERLPVMVTPRWLRTPTQPIAVRDVLYYLVRCAELPPDLTRAFDIGGPTVTTYQGMIDGYARVAGLPRRRVISVPVLTPRLSSRWVGLVTPVPSAIAKPLVDSLTVPSVCNEHDIADWIPDPPEGLVPYERSVELALTKIKNAEVRTAWSSSSVPGIPSEPLPSDPDWSGGALFSDDRETVVDASPTALWKVIEGLGGDNGYYSWPLAWEVRGWMDRFSGGVGLARGRRDPERLRVGDPLDFWRVEERIPQRLLRLRAEFRVPGLAWLELGIRQETDDRGRRVVTYTQRAIFHPKGAGGHAYWFSVAPFHGIVFGSMLRNIKQRAEALERGELDDPESLTPSA